MKDHWKSACTGKNYCELKYEKKIFFLRSVHRLIVYNFSLTPKRVKDSLKSNNITAF